MASPAGLAPDPLERRLEFETLLSDLSSQFVNLRPGEVDSEIEVSLSRVCEHLGIDLAVLWQGSVAATGYVTATHAYYALEGPRPFETLRHEEYPWARQEMLAGRIVGFSSLNDLPAEAALEREACRRFGIKSALCLPLSIGGEPPVGALAFNALRAEREWPDALVKRLKLIAQNFANALARKRHELIQQESETRQKAAAELAGLAFYEVDFSQRLIRMDDRFREICGVPPDREDGLMALEYWMERLHPEDRPRVLAARQSMHNDTLYPVTIEYRYLHPTQGKKWLQHVGSVAQRDASGRTVKSYGVLRDITSRKQAEDELRDLSSRLIRAHEEERAQLARELHDDLTQRLAVLAIEVGRNELAATDATQAGLMRSTREQLVRLSEDTRALAHQLHPSVLEELGLAEALRAECDRAGRSCRVGLELDPDLRPGAVGKDAALCLFRVAQEALNNVTRHAAARSVSVALRPIDGGLRLEVRDDGVGFDSASPGAGRNLGLVSMRERVRLVNGKLEIQSASGRGTAVVAWVPAGTGAP